LPNGKESSEFFLLLSTFREIIIFSSFNTEYLLSLLQHIFSLERKEGGEDSLIFTIEREREREIQ
jgi:hypothetical protein